MTETIALVVGVALGALVVWLVMRPRKPTEDDVTRAVRTAYLAVGLPDDQFGPDFNLLKAGKLQQVYHLAARELKVDPEFDTVRDVIRWLRE